MKDMVVHFSADERLNDLRQDSSELDVLGWLITRSDAKRRCVVTKKVVAEGVCCSEAAVMDALRDSEYKGIIEHKSLGRSGNVYCIAESLFQFSVAAERQEQEEVSWE